MFNNNSTEMKTVVETFVIEETQELIYDGEKLDQWNDLVKQLGLKGQNKIVQPEKSPIPFMHMPPAMVAICETLCPCKVNIQEYSITPIPVEILDVVALSVRERYFGKIEIWYDDKSPDPFCVGYAPGWQIDGPNGVVSTQHRGHHFHTREDAQVFIDQNELVGHKPYDYSYSAAKYLLGRWADVKATFAELRERARARFINETTVTVKKEIVERERRLADIELEAAEKFGGGTGNNNADLPF